MYISLSGKLLGSLSKGIEGTDRVCRLSFGEFHVQMLSGAALR